VTGVVFKPGADTRILGKAGVRILGVLDVLARHFKVDMVITSANDAHAAPDPHATGEAFDLRTHDWPDDQKEAVLEELLILLSDDPTTDAPQRVSIGLATKRFYGQLENPGQPTEHIHVQRRNHTTY
jgi:hypothetical protein